MIKLFYALCVLCLLGLRPALANTELHIIYTYAKDNFGQILSEFGQQQGVKIKSEFKEQNDLKSSMMGLMEANTAPDAIIMPSDHVGLHGFIRYSEIDRQLFPAAISERIWGSGFSDGKLYGVPLIQGNHLMLFYNKSLIKEPAADWTAMLAHKSELEAKGLSTIAWSFDEAYWFLPFLGAYGGWPLNNGKVELNTPAMAAALDFYKSLRLKSLPYPDCSYQCAVDLFKSGKVAYTINGDWIGKEFQQALGDNLGVSAIPSAEGKKMLPTFSTHVIAFPNNSLTGPKRATLIALANYLQDAKIQRHIWDLSGAIPVEESAFAYAQANAQGYLKKTIELMADTKPLPADKEMTFIWDAIGKGYLRHREGALDGNAAARYMQQLAERHIRNAQRLVEPKVTTP